MESDRMEGLQVDIVHYTQIVWPVAANDTATAGDNPSAAPVPNEIATSTASLSSTVSPTAPAATTSYIRKDKSKEMLKDLVVCNDLVTAKSLAAPIMRRYMHTGKGLYPLSAARAISWLPGSLDDAINISVLVMLRSSLQLGGNLHVLWRSLRKGTGAVSRIFRKTDSVLSLIIAKHWLSVVKHGQELAWDPLPIVDEISAVWNLLLHHSPPPPPPKSRESKYGMPHLIESGKPQIFKLCRQILRHAHCRRVAIIKASGVAGHLLPPELVDAISGDLYDKVRLMQVLRDLELHDTRGQPPSGLCAVKDIVPGKKQKHLTQSTGEWHICLGLKSLEA